MMNFNTTVSMIQQQKLLLVEPPKTNSALGKKFLVKRPQKREMHIP